MVRKKCIAENKNSLTIYSKFVSDDESTISRKNRTVLSDYSIAKFSKFNIWLRKGVETERLKFVPCFVSSNRKLYFTIQKSVFSKITVNTYVIRDFKESGIP